MPVDHYENFPVASWLLPKPLRAPVEALYRFARSADDLADEGDLDPRARLAELASYRARLDEIAAGRTPADPVFTPLATILREHALPLDPLYDLLSAFEQDVHKHRYADDTEIDDYCRRSANPVGRLMLHLFDRHEPADLEASDAICTSLQRINFLQDISVDRLKGRIYMPLDALARHGVDPEALLGGRRTGRWSDLIAEQAQRARRLMQAGAGLPRRIPGRVGLELSVTVAGGLSMLDRIESAPDALLIRRPMLNTLDRLKMLARGLL